MTSYQKLKLENEKLKQDIYNLVRKEKEMIGIETKMRYEIIYQMSDAIWMGSPMKIPEVPLLFKEKG